MVAFTPASDVWTLGYDQFDDICWRHNKTQELYYIPPGQPLTLPPRSLANVFRSNPPNSLPFTPAATARAEAYPLQGFGEAMHFNNSVLKVPEITRMSPAYFVRCTKPHPSPPMPRAEGAKQWLTPRCLANAPRPNLLNGPPFTPAAPARAEPFSLRGGRDRGQFDSISALKVPKAARVWPASFVEDTKRHPPPPTVTVGAETSFLWGDGEGEQFDNNSAFEVPEAGMVRAASFVEDIKRHPSPPVSTVEDAKHGFPPKSLANAPPSNAPNDPPSNPTAMGAETFLWGDEGEQCHPSPSVSTVEDAKRGLPPKSLANAPPSNIPNDPSFTLTATVGTEASSLWGDGEGEQFDNNSALEVPEAGRVRAASFVDETKRHPSSVSAAEDVKHGLPPKSLAIVPPSNIPNDPSFTPTATVGAETSLLWDKGEQFDNNSALEVPEAGRVRTASFVEETKRHPSPVSTAKDVNHGLPPKSLAIVPPSSIPNDPSFTPTATVGAEASPLWGGGEGEQFDNNSTLEVHEAGRVRTASFVKETKRHPSPPVSTAEDAKHGLPPKSLANAPPSNTPNDPSFTRTATVGTEASPLWGGGEGEQFGNNSALEVPETVRMWPAPIVDTTPCPSSPMSRAEEAKQWSRERDNRGKKYYFNIITGESQSEKPDCLKKYTGRR